MSKSPSASPSVPGYCLHKATGLAYVRLDGRDKYLGRHGTPESRAKYDRTVAEWLTTRSAPPSAAATQDPAQAKLTVAELCLAFWKHAQIHYRGPDGTLSEELGNFKGTLKTVRLLYGTTAAKDFGPLKLRAVRQQMIADGLMRTTINSRINRLRHVFKWAASLEMIGVQAYDRLRTVAGLQRGRTEAREPEPVRPVALDVVGRTLPHLPHAVADMVRLQLLTAMRPGEVCSMRWQDIDRTDAVWSYRPATHKTAWRGKSREIPLGEKSQAILAAKATMAPDQYLFGPTSTTATKAKRKVGVHNGPQSSGPPRRYSRTSYLIAVRRACDRAFPHPEIGSIKPSKRTEEQKATLRAWQKAHRWHPNQLRHTAATYLRSRFGLEAAQAVLGHSKADVTQIYAERDRDKARSVMREIG